MSIQQQPKKIFVLLPAATGHLNPVVSIMSQLIKEENVDVIFYSIDKYRQLIEKSGARYRPYSYYPESFLKTKSLNTEKNALLHDVRDMMEMSYRVLPALVEDVEKERPDLIIFDRLGLPGRYLSRLLRIRYRKKMTDFKPPKTVEACTTFASRPGVYPSEKQMKEIFDRDKNIWFMFLLAFLFMYQWFLSWTYGLGIYNPIRFFTNPEEEDPIVMVTIFPQLQPNSHLFGKNYRFVGCCVQEDVRNFEIKDPNLKAVMNNYSVINPRDSADLELPGRKRLIYVSLGTVFGDNDFIIEAIISGLKLMEEKNTRFDITVVLSLGDVLFKKFKKRIDNKKYSVPSNYLLQVSVPQIEILKRASLFITHCGMNSTSETIHFGVPVIAIPLNVDQPLCAQRIVDELRIGERFETSDLDENNLSSAFERLLSDNTYIGQAITYSKLSRQCDGIKNGCELINSILGKNKQI